MSDIEMQREMQRLKEIAEQNINLFLQVDNSGKGYVCPACGSGTGKNGTGLKANPKKPGYYHCFNGSCPMQNGDIIELIGRTQTTSADPKEITKAGCEHIRKVLGITKDNAPKRTYTKPQTQTPRPADTKDPVKEKAMQQAIQKTIKVAEKHLSESDYLTKRGISEKTAKRFHIGFCANWKYPGKATAYTESRIIIPLNEHTYTARDVSDRSNAKYIKVGGNAMFNPKALFDYTQPCFITEGEINALSIIEAGYNACALGGSQNTEMLVNELISRTPTHLILYLDNDAAGKTADIKLQETLSAMGISYTTITGTDADRFVIGKNTDANDFLVHDLRGFQDFLAEAQEKAKNALLAEKNEYIAQNNVAGYIDDFMSDIETRANTPSIKTGFYALDKALDGGLYEGLYVLGAISSLGKTTFILQAADQIAEQGQDVLFFSLEQSRNELIAKSISRETAQICDKQNIPLKPNAKTIRGITDMSRYSSYSPGEIETLASAKENYRTKAAQHLFIHEGLGDIGVKDIRRIVERHIRATGNKPVVFIDYLQIMAVSDSKTRTDKQVVDTNISDLKKLSRDLKLTIFGVSSFNRDSYTSGANMAAFKESGTIEYSSDVLIGLQFAGIDYTKQSETGKQTIREQIKEAKSKDPRPVQLVILKNRNGALGEVEFEYYPAYNLYKPKMTM